MEAQRASAQAASLFDRLAGAEQELGFEAARNVERLRKTGEGNTRLRVAAAAAENRLRIAEDALWRKNRELEDLRSKLAREGLVGSANPVNVGRSRRRGRRGSGRRRQGKSQSSGSTGGKGLEFRIFAAEEDARLAVERCSVAAGERRAAAGTALAEALQAVATAERTDDGVVVTGGDDFAEGTADDDEDGGEHMVVKMGMVMMVRMIATVILAVRLSVINYVAYCGIGSGCRLGIMVVHVEQDICVMEVVNDCLLCPRRELYVSWRV